METQLWIAQAGIQRAFGNPAAIADNEIIPAPAAGLRIKIVALVMWNNAATANTATLKSAAGAVGPPIVMQAAMHAPFILPFNEAGWAVLTPAQAFNVALTAATAVGIWVQYVLVPA